MLSYIRLEILDLTKLSEPEDGAILSIGCSMNADLSKGSFQRVMDEYVGRPNSFIYPTYAECEQALNNAKRALETDYHVKIGYEEEDDEFERRMKLQMNKGEI